MKIIIPTKGRINKQLTLENLPPELYVETALVCPSKEVSKLHNAHPLVGEIITQPDDNMEISEKRKWIIENAKEDKILMLDDDLRFAVRRDDDPGLFRRAEQEDIIRAFKELEDILSEEIPHAGFAVRGMGIGEAAKEGGWQIAKRMIYSLGYYLPIAKYWAEWGRVRTREDMDITLQLLEMGFPNKVNHSFVTDQKFGNEGGCTDERSIESSNADALILKELHPEYISVEKKDYTSSIPRLEVRVQWMKALRDGLQLRRENSQLFNGQLGKSVETSGS